MRWIAVLVMAVFVAAACGDDDTAFVTGTDTGAELSVDPGDRFELRLESNPSTGYRWVISGETMPATLDLVSVRYQEPDSDGDVVGAPGTEVFTFAARAVGADILRLEYVRPSDQPPIAERVVEFIVRVGGAEWPPASADGEPPPTVTAVAPTVPAGETVDVTTLFDGAGARHVVVSGSVVWDAASARLCEVLMESLPPQCGGMWVVIADPEHLGLELDHAQGVEWTAGPVELAAYFDGSRLILAEDGSVAPRVDDLAMVDALFAFEGAPGDRTVAGVPFGPDVALGLGPEIVSSFGADALTDPGVWQIDRDEFRGWAGPFSALDLLAAPFEVTVGAHPRCAAPPEPAPEGFESTRRVSIQPTEATSCLEWWTVDLFVDDGAIVAVTLDLFAP